MDGNTIALVVLRQAVLRRPFSRNFTGTWPGVEKNRSTRRPKMKHGLEVAGPASCERRIHRELWRNHLVRESSPFHLRRRCLLRPILVYACPLSLVRLVLNVRVCMYVGNLQFLMGLRPPGSIISG